MLTAFAEAARVLDRDDYRRVAECSAEFLPPELRQENSRLLRTGKQGEAKINAYLADYSYLIKGLLELYQTTFALSEPREIAIVGDPDSADTQALLTVVRDGYRPFQVVALGRPVVECQLCPYSTIGTLWTDSQQPMHAAISHVRHL